MHGIGLCAGRVKDMEKKEIALLIAEQAMEMILIFDIHGKIRYGNASAREKLGYDEKELEQQNMTRLFRQEFQDRNDGFHPFSAKKLVNDSEEIFYRKNGSCFPAVIRLLEPGSESDYYMLLADDITVRKELEKLLLETREEAKENLRLKDEFVANMTHELRTPVNGIKGQAESLLEDQWITQKVKSSLRIIGYCCDNMNSIINNILDFSKLEAGKFILEEKEFSFYGLIDHVIATNITAVNEKGLHMNVDISPDIPERLIGDELRVGQILNNLISNAIKFTSFGYISLEISRTMQVGDEMELFFLVRDTGIGISPEEKDRLFQSFTQVDSSVTRKFGGTGLGLAISKQLVEMMHGTVQLESVKGQGSSFSFYIKLRLPEDTAFSEGSRQEYRFIRNLDSGVDEIEDIGSYFVLGSPENRTEIKSRMEKLILCIEMGAWDKAERFAGNLKELAGNGDKELKKAVFCLEMAVRKADYAKSIDGYEVLKDLLQDRLGRNV